VEAGSPDEPQIVLTQVSAERHGVMERWNIDWLVENKSANTLHILAVRLPHGQFKSDERRFDPAIELSAGERRQFQTFVHCDEPAGLVTENAFVIFSVNCLGEPWRVFVRLRVVMTSDARPETATELITTQKVGFSDVDS
jgi:hypothetical protein